MTLIEIKTDLNRVAEALERIADLMEMAINPQPIPSDEVSTAEDLSDYGRGSNKDGDSWGAYYPRSNYK